MAYERKIRNSLKFSEKPGFFLMQEFSYLNTCLFTQYDINIYHIKVTFSSWGKEWDGC